RTQVIRDQYIVITDLRGFTRTLEETPMTTVEKLLDTLIGLTSKTAIEFGGTVRFNSADAYCLTFTDGSLAVSAAERLRATWAALLHAEGLHCSMNLAVHQGILYA